MLFRRLETITIDLESGCNSAPKAVACDLVIIFSALWNVESRHMTGGRDRSPGCLHAVKRWWRRRKRGRLRRLYGRGRLLLGDQFSLAATDEYDDSDNDERSAALFTLDESDAESSTTSSSSSIALRQGRHVSSGGTRVEKREAKRRLRIYQTLDQSIRTLDERASHVEERAGQKRKEAVAYHKRMDRHRARLYMREAIGLENLKSTLFAFMRNLLDLKLQVQQTQHVSEALRTMSEYKAIGQQLTELEQRYHVEDLMDDIRQGADRLKHFETVLGEPVYDLGSDTSQDDEERLLDRELDQMAQSAPMQPRAQRRGQSTHSQNDAPANSENSQARAEPLPS